MHGKIMKVVIVSTALFGLLFIIYACQWVNVNINTGTPAPEETPGPGPADSGPETGIAVDSEGLRRWADGTTACSCEEYRNPGSGYAYEGATGSGWYKMKLEGLMIRENLYCDMETRAGEGWTLVLLNSRYYQHPTPNWENAINTNNISGDTADGLNAGFDQLLGLRYWTGLGGRLRVETGSGPGVLAHQAIFDFSLDPDNHYAIHLSHIELTVGNINPHLLDYHNGDPFTTYDKDNDSADENCSSRYSNSPWWYKSCWKGNFWGGGTAGVSHQNSPYWTDSSTTGDYSPWGAFWIR